MAKWPHRLLLSYWDPQQNYITPTTLNCASHHSRVGLEAHSRKSALHTQQLDEVDAEGGACESALVHHML